MRRPALWDEVASEFKPELFDEPLHREIAESVRRHASPGKGFPLSPIMRDLRGLDKHVAAKLADMTEEVITTAEIGSLVEMLSELASRRMILDRMSEGAKLLRDLDTPLHEIMGDIQAGMIEAAYTLGHDGGRTWDEVLAQN